MGRREEWRKILDAEVQRWSAMPCDDLIAALREHDEFQAEFDAKSYRVKIEVLEITEKYLHVLVAVDEVGLPAAIRPPTRSFFCPIT